MKRLIERFASLVKGSLTGFDRVVFKGFILPLMSAHGAMSFCRINGILNKDYKKWMMKQTEGIVETAEQYAKANCGQGIIAIPTWRIRKEALAHGQQRNEIIRPVVFRPHLTVGLALVNCNLYDGNIYN